MNSKGLIKIAPSVLAADFSRLGEEIKEIERAGADLLHIDVMDGQFVPPITFGENMVKTARAHCQLYLETHLMVASPQSHFDPFIEAGSDRILFHIEAESHAHYALERLRKKGISAGLAVNPGTPIESVFELLELCDVVLVMTVNPGWGGQSFIDKMLGKIERLRGEIETRGLATSIEVDGGINVATGRRCRQAGADILVAGSSVFGTSDRHHAIQSLRNETTP